MLGGIPQRPQAIYMAAVISPEQRRLLSLPFIYDGDAVSTFSSLAVRGSTQVPWYVCDCANSYIYTKFMYYTGELQFLCLFSLIFL